MNDDTLKVKTSCHYCGKPITVAIPIRLYRKNPDLALGNACYTCVPEKSAARNGIDESAFDVIEEETGQL